tara:strand:+ start:253 stop:441 length:189 start_codon:yes stop_codon:yes gene_type:complete
MKTIGYRDILGGSINCYVNKNNPNQKRWDRFFEALKDLNHTGNIVIYRINGIKVKQLKVKRY